MNTQVTKGREGWEAETVVSINETQALRIRTGKGSRGVPTSATVVQPTLTGFIWSPFDDYSEELRKGVGLRCTDKTVRAEHEAALADIEGLKSRALAHYERKDAM